MKKTEILLFKEKFDFICGDFYKLDLRRDLRHVKEYYPYKYLNVLYFIIFTGMSLEYILSLRWKDIIAPKGNIRDRIYYFDHASNKKFKHLAYYPLREKLKLYYIRSKEEKYFRFNDYMFLNDINIYRYNISSRLYKPSYILRPSIETDKKNK